MKLEQAIECENHLLTAGKALRCCWRQMKHNGMESSAKEIADTVLDVETAAEQMRSYINGHDEI